MCPCMAVDSKRAVFKTALLAPGGTLIAWSIQQLISGEPFVGGVAFVVGLAFIAGFVVLQERDVPYEDEIAEILRNELSDYSSEEIATMAKQISENAGESVEDVIDERTDESE